MHTPRTLIHPTFYQLTLLATLLVLPLTAHAQPSITNLEVTATVSFDAVTGRFTYEYQLTSPTTNTGNVRSIDIDISTDLTETFNIESPVPEYKAAVLEALAEREIRILPVDTIAPPGWHSVNLTALGTAGWGGTTTNTIAPGEVLPGFTLTSFFMPGIRTITVRPQISTFDLYPDTADSDEVIAQKKALIESLAFVDQTLGPVGAFAGTFVHWNRLRDDLSRAVNELQWVDATLGATLIAQLAAARAELDAQQGTAAKMGLQMLLATLASTQAPIRSEARTFIELNAESLIQTTADTPVSFEPRVIVTPKVAELPIGAEYNLTAKVINVANNDEPVENFPLEFIIDQGPHADFEGDTESTDENGEATFTFVGTMVGTDKIRIEEELNSPRNFAQVTWTAGPDLVVPVFAPATTIVQTGDTIFISDRTANLGSIEAGPSVTRYFISDVEPVDPITALVIGERLVPSLEPEQESDSIELQFTIPSGFLPGTYFMAACADAEDVDPDDEINGAVVESNEENNCSFNELETIVSNIAMVEEDENNPPDCSQAAASPDSLWPPNHKLVDIDITGITDPEGSPVTLTIMTIEQDEPVNGVADGDTSPDGFGVGTAQASVRRERAGDSNGRIYEIGFSAEDGQGASCTGSVLVSVVPHDQGQGSTPIDDGVRFDSTEP